MTSPLSRWWSQHTVQARGGREAEGGDGRRHTAGRRGRSGNAGSQEGLKELFQSWNLAIGPSAILDPRLNIRGQPFYVYVPIVGQIRQPIVDSLINRFVLVPRSSPINILSAQSARQAGVTFNQQILPTAILRTSNQSWGETDLTSRKVEGAATRTSPVP